MCECEHVIRIRTTQSQPTHFLQEQRKKGKLEGSQNQTRKQNTHTYVEDTFRHIQSAERLCETNFGIFQSNKINCFAIQYLAFGCFALTDDENAFME